MRGFAADVLRKNRDGRMRASKRDDGIKIQRSRTTTEKKNIDVGRKEVTFSLVFKAETRSNRPREEKDEEEEEDIGPGRGGRVKERDHLSQRTPVTECQRGTTRAAVVAAA